MNVIKIENRQVIYELKRIKKDDDRGWLLFISLGLAWIWLA